MRRIVFGIEQDVNSGDLRDGLEQNPRRVFHRQLGDRRRVQGTQLGNRKKCVGPVLCLFPRQLGGCQVLVLGLCRRAGVSRGGVSLDHRLRALDLLHRDIGGGIDLVSLLEFGERFGEFARVPELLALLHVHRTRFESDAAHLELITDVGRIGLQSLFGILKRLVKVPFCLCDVRPVPEFVAFSVSGQHRGRRRKKEPCQQEGRQLPDGQLIETAHLTCCQPAACCQSACCQPIRPVEKRSAQTRCEPLTG